MQMQCKKVQKCDFFVTLVRFDLIANFDSVFLHWACNSHFFAFCTFSHFVRTIRIFFTLITSFWFNNLETTTKKVEKMRECEKNTKSAMQMQNVNVMQKQCDAMVFDKKCKSKCNVKKFLRYHPCLSCPYVHVFGMFVYIWHCTSERHIVQVLFQEKLWYEGAKREFNICIKKNFKLEEYTRVYTVVHLSGVGSVFGINLGMLLLNSFTILSQNSLWCGLYSTLATNLIPQCFFGQFYLEFTPVKDCRQLLKLLGSSGKRTSLVGCRMFLACFFFLR